MTYCPFCGAELLPGALSFRHRLSLWCAGEERTSPRLRRGSAQLALPILCSRWLYEKGRLRVWGSFLFIFSSGPGLSGPAPRCGNSFSSGEAGEPLGGLVPQLLRHRHHQGVQKGGGEERGHPSPFDNNIGSRRASTRRHKAKPAAVLTPSWGSSGTFDENMLDSGTEIKHSET